GRGWGGKAGRGRGEGGGGRGNGPRTEGHARFWLRSDLFLSAVRLHAGRGRRREEGRREPPRPGVRAVESLAARILIRVHQIRGPVHARSSTISRSVPAIDTAIDPAQPSLFEKNTNTHLLWLRIRPEGDEF